MNSGLLYGRHTDESCLTQKGQEESASLQIKSMVIFIGHK